MSIVVTTQRKKGALILFAVSLHFVDMSWKHDSHLLSVKYYSSVSQFERSFLDLLVKHNIQNKVLILFYRIENLDGFFQLWFILLTFSRAEV